MSEQNKNEKNLINQRIQESDVSVYAYDLALVKDLRARFTKKGSKEVQDKQVNETVQIGSAQNMFNILGTLNQDEVVMPFVSLERIDWQLNLDRQGFQTFIGEKVFTRMGNDNIPTEVRAQVIPITINYRMSVWTKDRVTNDALVRELLFYYHLRPSLLVKVPHGLNIAHKFNIYFNSGIEDNSDIANFETNGTYFRQDMTLYTDDAYLWRANWMPTVQIDANTVFNYGDINTNITLE